MIRYFLSVIIITVVLYAALANAANDPDALYRQGKFAEAQKLYTEADMNNPKDLRYRYNRGCAAYQNSDYRAAAAAFSSVLKRTEDKEIKFKALYNLGNTAFKQKDFESAVSYYKQAVICKPENEDARYNLKLALREFEKQKKNNNARKNTSKQDSQKEEDKPGRSGENKNDADKNQKPSDNKSPDNKQNKNAKNGTGKQNDALNNKEKEQNPGNNIGHKSSENNSQDLSGKQNPFDQMQQQKENIKPEQIMSALDKKKANALLESIREDRSKFVRFQSGNDKDIMRSGKDW